MGVLQPEDDVAGVELVAGGEVGVGELFHGVGGGRQCRHHKPLHHPLFIRYQVRGTKQHVGNLARQIVLPPIRQFLPMPWLRLVVHLHRLPLPAKNHTFAARLDQVRGLQLYPFAADIEWVHDRIRW